MTDQAALVQARRIMDAAKEIDAALERARKADAAWTSSDHMVALAVAAAWHVGENACQETATADSVNFALRVFDLYFVGALQAFFPDRCAPDIAQLADELLAEIHRIDPNYRSAFPAGHA